MKEFETIQEAVLAAKSGDKDAYAYLYEVSFREKHAIALRYMRNNSDAEDVVSEAYTIAWERLDTLENPDRFLPWLGQIVANTAINSLKKKKPLPFSSIGSEDDEFFPDVADEKIDGQPELSYTTKERSEIIESMLDALSTEQRVCVVMYYMEGMTAPEIAEVLDCPVSTVKSRLKYAKDNLHKQADILKKNGYNFYGVAPVPLLLYLLESEAAENGVVLSMVGVGAAAGTAATIGKVTAVIGGTLLVAGLTVGTIFTLSSNEAINAGYPYRTTVASTTEEPIKEESADEETLIKDTDLPGLISGGHTKRDLELLLLYAPVKMKDGLSKQEISDIVRGALLESEDEVPPMIHELEPDYVPVETKTLKISIINQFIRAITDYQLGDKDTTLPDLPVVGEDAFVSGVNVDPQKVDGKSIWWKKCQISKVLREGDEIKLEFTRTGRVRIENKGNYIEGDRISIDQNAILRKLRDGSYRIAEIDKSSKFLS